MLTIPTSPYGEVVEEACGAQGVFRLQRQQQLAQLACGAVAPRATQALQQRARAASASAVALLMDREGAKTAWKQAESRESSLA